MLSFRRYGYRMIGAPMLFSGPVTPPPASAFGGELAPTAPPAGPVAPLLPTFAPISTGATVTAAPYIAPLALAPASAASFPACPPCAPCPITHPPMVAPVATGMALGGLLMYVVGLLTREHKKRRRNPRRKAR